MAAVLDTWRPTSIDECALLAPVLCPDPQNALNADWWAFSALPAMGGSAYYYE